MNFQRNEIKSVPTPFPSSISELVKCQNKQPFLSLTRFEKERKNFQDRPESFQTND